MIKYLSLNLISVLFLVLISIFFLHKKPIYQDNDLNNLVTYITKNIDNESIIQTDLIIYKNNIRISPIIRSLAKKNIYFDNSFPFNFKYSNEWLKRKKNITDINKDILNNNYHSAFCKLKQNKISFFLSRSKNVLKNIDNYIDYRDNIFVLYNLINYNNC